MVIVQTQSQTCVNVLKGLRRRMNIYNKKKLFLFLAMKFFP